MRATFWSVFAALLLVAGCGQAARAPQTPGFAGLPSLSELDRGTPGRSGRVDQRHCPSSPPRRARGPVLRDRKGAAPQIKRPLTAPDIENLVVRLSFD